MANTPITSFQDIQGEWESVLRVSPADTLFLTPQWQKVWWDLLEPDLGIECGVHDALDILYLDATTERHSATVRGGWNRYENRSLPCIARCIDVRNIVGRDLNCARLREQALLADRESSEDRHDLHLSPHGHGLGHRGQLEAAARVIGLGLRCAQRLDQTQQTADSQNRLL